MGNSIVQLQAATIFQNKQLILKRGLHRRFGRGVCFFDWENGDREKQPYQNALCRLAATRRYGVDSGL